MLYSICFVLSSLIWYQFLLFLGYLNLTSNRVTGVSAAFEKNTGDHIETKGIKAHFNLDDSGMLVLDTTGRTYHTTQQKKL